MPPGRGPAEPAAPGPAAPTPPLPPRHPEQAVVTFDFTAGFPAQFSHDSDADNEWQGRCGGTWTPSTGPSGGPAGEQDCYVYSEASWSAGQTATMVIEGASVPGRAPTPR